MAEENSSANEPMSNIDKAFALARLGIKVFPADRATRRPLIGGGNGFYDATLDFEQIATWFSVDFPNPDNTVVAYWAGGSGLFVLDVDRGKKNGKNGFKSIKDRGLHTDMGATFFYRTESGGQHHVFQTDRDDLTLSSDYDGMEGVDVRAGGSYAVWWGDTVPDTREVFEKNIPEWMVKVSETDTFTGVGFSGSVSEWLNSLPSDEEISTKTQALIDRIPRGLFGHHEMTALAWAIVRMGAERETGIRVALDKLRDAWLRDPFDTPDYRRDFDLALKGAINKAGRVQNEAPTKAEYTPSITRAKALGITTSLAKVENSLDISSTEIDLSRARKEMFKLAASVELPASMAMSVVEKSKAFKLSTVVNYDSVWFSDGEPEYHDKEAADEVEIAAEEAKALARIDEDLAEVAARTLATLAADSARFSFLTPEEQKQAGDYKWWGKEYLDFVESRLKHFNKPYHVSAMWAALSVIASPWGKVWSQGGKPVDCNLYIGSLGDSTSGKTEAWEFGIDVIDAVYGTDEGPIIGDISKVSALSVHRTLILRDGKPSIVFGDEIQSFFQGVSNSQWQSGILGDISSHYGGNVQPKNMLNDKEISGKRAKTLFTTYLTGIADQTLDAVSLNHWTNGLLYRFLWSFGEPRKKKDHKLNFSSSATADYTKQMETWGHEFKRLGAVQEMAWGAGREVEWEPAAQTRMEWFSQQIENEVEKHPLYDDVFVSANVRFYTSILKCATLIALAEASERVTLDHVLVAIDYAGPWHRSLVLAVMETAKDPFDREVEKVMKWIRRNAIEQVGKTPYIQRSAVMRAFKPNEVAERYLRQLTEEGWLTKTGNNYEINPEERS